MKKYLLWSIVFLIIFLCCGYLGYRYNYVFNVDDNIDVIEEESRDTESIYLSATLYKSNKVVNHLMDAISLVQGFYITDYNKDNEIIWYSYKNNYHSDTMNIVGYRDKELLYEQKIIGAGHGQNFIITHNDDNYGIVSGSFGTKMINDHYASYGISIVPTMSFSDILDLRSSGANFDYYTANFSVYNDTLVVVNGSGIRLYHFADMEQYDYFKVDGIIDPIQGVSLWENNLYILSGTGPRLYNTVDDVHLYKIDIDSKTIISDNKIKTSKNFEPEGLNVIEIEGKPELFFGAVNYSKLGIIEIWKVDEMP